MKLLGKLGGPLEFWQTLELRVSESWLAESNRTHFDDV